jgi:hypothetical protein
MTSTVPHDSLDPTADQPAPRPDELEHWLTGIRVDLSDDTQAWLDPGGDTGDPADERSTGLHAAKDQGAQEEREPSRPHIGRHRAAD